MIYELANIYEYTEFPSITDLFWESVSNKRKFIDCAYEYYLEHPMKANLTIVYSGYLLPKEDTWENRQKSFW